MTVTLLDEPDPYVLPMPFAGSPVVADHLVVALHARLNARYSDGIWPLAPLTDNPSEVKRALHWRNCPQVFQDEVRLIAWTLINGALRPSFLKDRSTKMRSRLSVVGTNTTVVEWMRLARWLEKRDIHTLAKCDSQMLHEYGLHIRDSSPRGRETARTVLNALTRLWAFDELSARPAGVGRPPWDEFGADDYLPAATSRGGENTTEVLAEQTMGPLLIWAIRMVDDLADDILAAWEVRKQLVAAARSNPANQAGKEALDALLIPLVNSGSPLPTTSIRGHISLARYYVGGLTGASKGHIQDFVHRHRLKDLAPQRPGPCPMDSPITGRIAGRPWREVMDFNETVALMRHLGTAAFVVLSYLTGMRPGEVLGLRTGCCPDPEPGPDGRVGRHLIRGNEYKTAIDEDGNHRSAGAEREVPWVAITPVVHAIRVLERMVPDGHLLFDHNAHDLHRPRPDTGSLKHESMRTRIEAFVEWANQEAVRLQTGDVIAPDPHGRIGVKRFRRSLAWHIARRPGGLVALAVQYGHLRTAFVTEGYAARSRDGIHELIDIETVRAVADTVADLHDDLEAGGGVSGPAARRAINAAARAPRFEGTIITATTARRLLANEDALLYDNPHALLLCHYRREQALCHRGIERETPSLDHCVTGCGNIVRTDQHAAQLRGRADILARRAEHVPQPMAERFRKNATRLRDLARQHDQSRITLEKELA
ncbi:integrase [Streptomyces chattanoogensis]|uniref:integrase n=1 Tax=Streptomyces chattanoogensis TaxID=66876 RepID=UPI00369DBFC3